MAFNPYQKYQEQSVMTMTHGEMLTKLYEQIIKQLNTGILAIRSENNMAANTALKKAQEVIAYLRSTLDFKYDISHNLASLYQFFNEQIIDANIHKDVKPLQDILPLVEDLKDTFIQADKLARMEKRAPAARIG